MPLAGAASLMILVAVAAGEGDAPPENPLAIDDLYPEAVAYEHLYTGFLSAPYGIFCDAARGEMFVADTGNSQIGIFNLQGISVYSFSDRGRLKEPFAVVVDRRGRMYVLDAELNRVKLYSYRGEFVKYLELEGFGEKTEARFTALALDTNGDLYLANATSGEILVFDPSGRRKRSIGSKGTGPGQFQNVQGIALDATTVFASDTTSLGVQLFDKYGRYQRGWGRHEAGSANVSLPAGIAVDAKGRIFLVDTLRHEIKAYSSVGKLIGEYGGAGDGPGEVIFPVGLSADGRGNLCVADRGNNRVQVLSVREPKPKPEDAATTKPKPEDAATTKPKPEGAATTQPGPEGAATTQGGSGATPAERGP